MTLPLDTCLTPAGVSHDLPKVGSEDDGPHARVAWAALNADESADEPPVDQEGSHHVLRRGGIQLFFFLCPMIPDKLLRLVTRSDGAGGVHKVIAA